MKDLYQPLHLKHFVAENFATESNIHGIFKA